MKDEKDELAEFVREKIEAIRELAPMNEDLKEWLEKGKISHPLEKGKIKGKKKKFEKCEICGRRKAKFVCIKCGKKVCASCYRILFGLCKECAPEETVEKWNKSKKFGIEWVE
jgi:RecJ-like exonuclease